jgi:hypothetical protein
MGDLIEHFRTAMYGVAVSHVWRGHGSALFVEFGALTARTRRDGSPSEPQGQLALMIQWSWRIEDEQTILCGSWSDEHLWPPAFARLIGYDVVDVSAFGRLPEVCVSLASGLRILSFNTSEGDPAWALFNRSKGVSIHSAGGSIRSADD